MAALTPLVLSLRSTARATIRRAGAWHHVPPASGSAGPAGRGLRCRPSIAARPQAPRRMRRPAARRRSPGSARPPSRRAHHRVPCLAIASERRNFTAAVAQAPDVVAEPGEATSASRRPSAPNSSRLIHTWPGGGGRRGAWISSRIPWRCATCLARVAPSLKFAGAGIEGAALGLRHFNPLKPDAEAVEVMFVAEHARQFFCRGRAYGHVIGPEFAEQLHLAGVALHHLAPVVKGFAGAGGDAAAKARRPSGSSLQPGRGRCRETHASDRAEAPQRR